MACVLQPMCFPTTHGSKSGANCAAAAALELCAKCCSCSSTWMGHARTHERAVWVWQEVAKRYSSAFGSWCVVRCRVQLGRIHSCVNRLSGAGPGACHAVNVVEGKGCGVQMCALFTFMNMVSCCVCSTRSCVANRRPGLLPGVRWSCALEVQGEPRSVVRTELQQDAMASSTRQREFYMGDVLSGQDCRHLSCMSLQVLECHSQQSWSCARI